MAADSTAWLAEELSLTLIEEGPEGRARALTGSAPAPTLIASLAQLAGIDEADAGLRALLDAARRGKRGSLAAPGGAGRIVAWRHQGRVRALFAPGTTESVAQKAAAADLAAGVTHEVANALTAIAGWARMASGGGPLPDRTRQALDVVQKSARDALGTARGLLRTMRDSQARDAVVANRPEQTNVALVVREVLDTLRPELEEAGVALELDAGRDAIGPTTPAALRLIVSNLVRNAFEAISSGGHVRVGVQRRGSRIYLTVADDGPGMNGRTLSRAFDRYFTTKASGTGLGLALVRDTVHEAGGTIEVQSRRGSGTRFEVWLPATPGARARKRATTSSSGVHPKPALVDRAVLVVDDDDAMRSLVRTALELSGARVTTAAMREEALAHEERFALALVDLTLGDDRGDTLMAELRARGLIDKAILITGSPDPAIDPLAAPDALLLKPFELDELSRVIDAVLAHAPLQITEEA